MHNFLVLHEGHVCCGKCGKVLFNDKREIAKHEKQCHVILNKEIRPIDEIQAYTLKAQENSLLLTIVQATAQTSFSGIKWKPIYSCEFFKDGKTYKEEGEKNLAYWLEMLELDMLFNNITSPEQLNMSKEPCYVIINKVFSGVGYITSVADFINRFLTKGFKNKEIDLKEIRKIPSIKLDFNITKQQNTKNIKFCQLKEVEIGKDVIYSCCCVEGSVEDGKLIPRTKTYIYISHNFVYNPNKFNIYDFLSDYVYYGRFRYEKYQKAYPEVKLKEYIESGGKDYLDFLLSENNNFALEITGKSELGYLANMLGNLTTIDKSATTAKNIFGLPLKALRNLNNEQFVCMLDDDALRILKEAYKIQPAIFTEPLTQTEMYFLNSKLGKKGNVITACKENPKDLLEYARYCRTLTEKEYSTFVDYSNMCNSVKLWPYKKFPETGKLQEAHDVLVQYINEKRKATESKNFEEALGNVNYINLIDLPSKEFYTKSKYTMLMPRSAQDLVEESYQMRNCVRSYISAVASGRTFILFFRKKAKKSNSFVTVEVTPELRLIQVKGKGNSRPDEETREWIKQWCKDKGIDDSDCYDIRENVNRYWW